MPSLPNTVGNHALNVSKKLTLGNSTSIGANLDRLVGSSATLQSLGCSVVYQCLPHALSFASLSFTPASPSNIFCSCNLFNAFLLTISKAYCPPLTEAKTPLAPYCKGLPIVYLKTVPIASSTRFGINRDCLADSRATFVAPRLALPANV